MSRPPTSAVVIGVGNPFRGDDGIGPRAIELLGQERPRARLVACDGEPTRLIDAWSDADLAVVVDAVVSGAAPGTLHTVEAAASPPPRSGATSSHATGVAEAWALAEALDALPRRLVVIGVEAEAFDPGTDLSPAVQAALPAVLHEVRTLLASRPHSTPRHPEPT